MKSIMFAVSLALFCATAMAAPPSLPPNVRVAFVVDSPIFQFDLTEETGTSHVSECEARVTEAMRATLAGNDLFPYLNWITAGTGDYTFKATLRDDGPGDSNTSIVYEGNMGEVIAHHELFFWSEDLPFDSGPLIDLIVDRVKADLQGASKAAIENNFANSVVLVKTVEVLQPSEKKTIKVPIAGVITNDDSILRVSFERVSFENSSSSPGYMKLGRALPKADGIFCRVTEFSLDEIDKTGWDDRIPDTMKVVQNVRVTMESFRRRIYDNTTGGSVNLPD